MATRRALLVALGAALAGCGTARRSYDPGTAAPPPMDYEPVTPATPTPRSSPLPVDRSVRWPQPYVDGRNTSSVPSTGPTARPSVQWEVWLSGIEEAIHALVEGPWLYVFGERRVVVLDRRTGALNRSIGLRASVETAPSLARAGFVSGTYTEDREPGIALQGTVGELYWRRGQGSVVVPPAVDSDRAYVVDDDSLVARSLDDGDVQWRFSSDEGDNFASYPAVADGTVYLHGRRGSTCAVAAETGEQRWRRETDGGHPPAVVPTAGRSVVLGGFESGAGTVAYDRRTGEPRWQTDRRIAGGTHALATDRTVATTTDGRVVALSLANGDETWGVQSVTGQPVVAAETVYLRGPGPDGAEQVVALSLADGTRRWRRPVSGGGWLVVADEYCYLNRGDGVIECWG